MKIKRLIKRHSPGCFDVEDENGDCFRIQLAFKIEEQWQHFKKYKTLDNFDLVNSKEK